MAYGKRYAGGFVDKPTLTTPIDATFLNAVEAALLKLFDTDPSADGQVLQWINASTKYGPALLLNKNIDPAAGIVKSKLDFTGGNGIVNADIAGAAAIAKSKLAALGIVNADVDAAAAIAKSKLAALAIGDADVSAISPTKITGFPDSILPWLIDIDVFGTPISHVNFNSNFVDSASLYCGYKQSSGALNDEISWDVVLAAGTWDIELVYYKTTTGGIYSVQLDTVEKGTIDSYAAAPSYNNRSTVIGVVVATTGKKRLKLKMATKNASSGAYYGILSHVQLRRTA